ncbi:MAG: acetyl-CoA carboxylase biotin carboxyl carrier protein subunit [Clostridia bacterium]|nr:acetyl-CoA carboxylase biotin carboxyl carrier protein subunit [Clostridia bacterium]
MRNFIVTIDGKQYQVGVEEVGATASATPVVTEIKSAPVAAAPAAAPAPAAKPAAAGPVNGTKVNAPMPGMIKSLSLPEGSAVKEGDVILVLEAMKMDNDITAPCSGTISYKTTKGSNVDTGDLMAVIG